MGARGPQPKYNDEELIEAIGRYFADNPERPTVTGLAYFLGFEDRRSLYDYKGREETSHTIKQAVLKIESLHEENLFNQSCTGSIFWLKNRDWVDKQTVDQKVEMNQIRHEVVMVDPKQDDGDNNKD
jgi:hypothetical protein